MHSTWSQHVWLCSTTARHCTGSGWTTTVQNTGLQKSPALKCSLCGMKFSNFSWLPRPCLHWEGTRPHSKFLAAPLDRHIALSAFGSFLKNSSAVKSVFCLSLASHADTANPSQIIPDAASLPAAVTASASDRHLSYEDYGAKRAFYHQNIVKLLGLRWS